MRQNSVEYHTFPSGLRLVCRGVESPVAYVGIMVGAGTRDELPQENGMAHYIEHCVFKGTTSRSSRQIINRIEHVGGEINAYTTKEETVYYAAVPTEHACRALDVLSDMILHPTFLKTETDKEKQVIYDEIESYNDSPSELIYDDFESLVFDGHPLAQPILGTKKTLRSFNTEKAYAFMRRTYRPNKMVVFVESDQPFSRVKKMVEKNVEMLIPTSVYATPEPTPESARICPLIIQSAMADYHKHTHQTHVMLGGRAYPLGHERQLAMYLMNNILGGGSMNSLLNLSLREQKGLVYTVESIYTPLSDTGYWSVYFACDPENKEECARLVREQLRQLREKPLTEAFLRRAVRQLRGQMAISAENRENSVLSMAKQMLYYGYSPSLQETLDKIAALTTEDLHEVAKEIFDDGNMFCLQYC